MLKTGSAVDNKRPASLIETNGERLPDYGFSLIEILAAIAVVGILVVIAFPLITKVRNQSNVAIDTSNLRNIGQAVALYKTEFQSYPGAGFSVVGRVREAVIQSENYNYSPMVDGIHLAEKLYPFAPDQKIFRTPVYPEELDPGQWKYRHNMTYFGYVRFGRPPAGLFDIENPSATWQMTSNDVLNDERLEGAEPVNNMRNYLFGDGHVKRLTVEAEGWDP